MDRTDLVRQLSNLVTQISAVGKTKAQPHPAPEAIPAQVQAREALVSLLNQNQSGQVLARWIPEQQPSTPVIPTVPNGKHLVSILIKGQTFLLSTALELKQGMTVQFSVQGNSIQLQPGPISPPTAQLNSAIQVQVNRAPSTAPPPFNTAPLQQALNSTINTTQLQQLSSLLGQLPSLTELIQPNNLQAVIDANRAPLAQQLGQLLQKNGDQPLINSSSGTHTAPNTITKSDQLASLLQLMGSRNLTLLVSALAQALPAAAQAPEPQPLALQLPSLNYPFPQKSSPAERNNDVGALLKRMAHWFRATQEQQQLHQLLQLQSSNPADELARANPQLWLDIPFRVDQQLHWMQLHLQRNDTEENTTEQEKQGANEQVWQLQLRLERPETGAIFASIYFRTPKLDVQFWAEQPDTLNKLREALPEFTDILKSEGVEECSVAANPGAMTTTTTALDQRRLHLEA